MTTLEEKAKAYADKIYDSTTEVWHFGDEVHEMLMEAYLAGAAEALRSQWKDAGKELPEEDEYCIILGPCGMQAACWNSHYQSWDDEQGDDHLYDKEQVTHWLSIPEIPDTQEP